MSEQPAVVFLMGKDKIGAHCCELVAAAGFRSVAEGIPELRLASDPLGLFRLYQKTKIPLAWAGLDTCTGHGSAALAKTFCRERALLLKNPYACSLGMTPKNTL